MRVRGPSFQFYPADWLTDNKLQKCSPAAQGAWISILCILHDEEDYGIWRDSIEELARMIRMPVDLVRELLKRDVLKCNDDLPFLYTPRHHGTDGDTVILIPAQEAPIAFSSRLVRDSHISRIRSSARRSVSLEESIKNQKAALDNDASEN